MFPKWLTGVVVALPFVYGAVVGDHFGGEVLMVRWAAQRVCTLQLTNTLYMTSKQFTYVVIYKLHTTACVC